MALIDSNSRLIKNNSLQMEDCQLNKNMIILLLNNRGSFIISLRFKRIKKFKKESSMSEMMRFPKRE